MSQQSILTKTFTAGSALEAFRRVKLSGSTVVYAGAGEACIGVTQTVAVASGDPVTVALAGRHQTFKLTAAGAINNAATVYAAASGKVSASAVGNAAGTALAAATGDGSVIEVLLDNGYASNVGPVGLADDATNNGAVPFVLWAEVNNATSAAASAAIATLQRKAKLINWHVVSRDTNAANVKLVGNSTDLTAVVAKGTADAAIVAGSTIVAAADELAAGTALKANISALGACDVFAEFIPIA